MMVMEIEPLTEEQLDELRGALEAEKDAVEEELSDHGVSVDSDWQGTSSSHGEEADSTDAADNIEELVTNVPLVEELEKRHKELVAALERMDDGSYGLCENGGEPIPYDRLEANPAARTCLEHV
jgi:RNA polymerase-binding transcription factor DksA